MSPQKVFCGRPRRNFACGSNDAKSASRSPAGCNRGPRILTKNGSLSSGEPNSLAANNTHRRNVIDCEEKAMDGKFLRFTAIIALIVLVGFLVQPSVTRLLLSETSPLSEAAPRPVVARGTAAD